MCGSALLRFFQMLSGLSRELGHFMIRFSFLVAVESFLRTERIADGIVLVLILPKVDLSDSGLHNTQCYLDQFQRRCMSPQQQIVVRANFSAPFLYLFGSIHDTRLQTDRFSFELYPRTETGRSKESPALLQWHVFPVGFGLAALSCFRTVFYCFSLTHVGGCRFSW
jgi:hypothetical protein